MEYNTGMNMRELGREIMDWIHLTRKRNPGIGKLVAKSNAKLIDYFFSIYRITNLKLN
jgi:hypothetical protein